MTDNKVLEFLLKKPGYQQWGDVRIANRLNVDLEIVKQAKQDIKNISYKDKSTDIKEVNLRKPTILILDIETAPMLAYTWGIWKQMITPDSLESNWFMLSWAAKWLGEEEVFGEVIHPDNIQYEYDYELVKKLWYKLEEADIVITHNGDKFDIKKINTRFIKYGLGPVSPYQSIDTLKIVKRKFSFTSNKLDELAKFFRIKGKHSTSFELWRKCMYGDIESLNYMLEYNKQDVVLLEGIYNILLPWINNHPNMGLFILDDYTRCPNCGGSHLTEIKSFKSSIASFKTFRCHGCGALSRERQSQLSKEENKTILTNVK